MPTTSTGTPGTTIVAECSVPSANDLVTGAGLKTAIDPINDDLASVRDNVLCNTTVRAAAGDPDDACGGTFKLYGEIQLLDNGSSVGAIRLGATTQIIATDPAAFLRFQARKRLLRRRVTLTDASQTINVSQGDRFNLNGGPASPRTITVSKTTGSPEEGETIALFWFSVLEVAGVAAKHYTIARADGTTIAELWASGATATSKVHWLEVEYCLVSTGPDVYDWRLGQHSGTMYDGTTDYGVIPGGGA